MTEKELIDLFDRFGYLVMKNGDLYDIFDRRIARRISDKNTLKNLSNYAENIFMLPFWTETLERTLEHFQGIYSPVTIPAVSPETVPAAPATGEETDQDPEQKQEETPAPPVIDQPKVLPVYDLVCKGCGKRFQANRRKAYCSPECYPSHKDKKTPETGVKAMPRPF